VSVLVVGLSHRSAPVATLERAAVSSDALVKLLADLAHAEPVAESFVISTCNRVEVYAEVDRFHAGVTAICELLARHWGMPLRELTQYVYVHYEDRAVGHLLAVAWTRWWWAMSRSSARYARRSGWPPSMAPSAGSWATWAGWRCGPVSGPGPRPGSGGPASAC
jgi:Glutamyl-tRNAGlu reductase, N-terminal domain